jgi:replication factor C subunit 2/4
MVESDVEMTQHEEERPGKVIPWIEKYRPATVEDIAHQDDVVRALRTCIERKNLPNLLFYGPPGTGKTSCIIAAARQLFGTCKLYKDRVLELNASDERGIAVVREKVKKFANLAVTQQPNIPSFKIIILDEADSMTKDAQAALRRTMESTMRITRFCIICNYVSRIIEPVTSRCAKFRFQSIPAHAQVARLQTIALSEGFECDENALNALVTAAEGDMRRSVALLQSAKSLCAAGDRLTADAVLAVSGMIPAEFITHALSILRQGNFGRVREFAKELSANGYSVAGFFTQLQDSVVAVESLTDSQKAKIARIIATVDGRLNDGADEQLQSLWALTTLRTVCQTA